VSVSYCLSVNLSAGVKAQQWISFNSFNYAHIEGVCDSTGWFTSNASADFAMPAGSTFTILMWTAGVSGQTGGWGTRGNTVQICIF
jgi:hypothetical protein